MASRFTHIREFVEQEIEHRRPGAGGPLAPSQYWLDYNQFSSYVRTLPDGELRFIRRHGRGVVESKGLESDLHERLARRFVHRCGNTA